MLLQMQHPIQMKPADSEKRGKFHILFAVCFMYHALLLQLVMSKIVIINFKNYQLISY